jgi:hypothetical protein
MMAVRLGGWPGSLPVANARLNVHQDHACRIKAVFINRQSALVFAATLAFLRSQRQFAPARREGRCA